MVFTEGTGGTGGSGGAGGSIVFTEGTGGTGCAGGGAGAKGGTGMGNKFDFFVTGGVGGVGTI